MRSQLVAEHDIRARGGDLVKNVKSIGQQRFPVTHAPLLNNQINSLGLAPFFQDSVLIKEDIERPGAERSLYLWILIHERKFPVQIKNQTTALVERSFKEHFAFFIQPPIEKPAQIGKRKIRSDSSDVFHHAKPGGNHRDTQG